VPASLAGTCEFDLPSYHHWLHQDAHAAAQLPKNLPNSHAPHTRWLAIILKLLRESGKAYITLPTRVAFSNAMWPRGTNAAGQLGQSSTVRS